MAFARASAVRSAYKAVRPLRTSVRKPQSWHQIGKRSYASHGEHATKQAGSDLPWLIGSVAVTVPSCWYLMQPSEGGDHGHGGHGDGHSGKHDEEGSKDEPAAAEESNDSENDSKKSDDSDSDGEGKEADTPETSDDEGSGKPEENADNAQDSDDPPAASKSAGNQNTQSGKQEGLSNADTKHSSDVTNKEISKKSKNSPETAKSKGTVDTR